MGLDPADEHVSAAPGMEMLVDQVDHGAEPGLFNAAGRIGHGRGDLIRGPAEPRGILLRDEIGKVQRARHLQQDRAVGDQPLAVGDLGQ